MTSIRQDAWNEDEDLYLVEVVLRHIREGSTQLAAFDEVGKKLSRTAAACGFRWNSYVRKQYKSAIEIAKEQRKTNRRMKTNNKEELKITNSSEPANITFNDVLSYLNDLKKVIEENEHILNDYRQLQQKVSQLENENKKLKKDLKTIKENSEAIQEDYKSLVSIMDRARKIVEA